MKRRGMILLPVFIVALGVLAMAAVCMAQSQAPAKAAPANEPAQPWKLYLESENRKYYFDPSSVEVPEKRVVRVWEKITEKSKDGEETDKVKSLIELDCSSSRYRIIAWKEYDAATKTEKPEVRNDGESWSYFDQDNILGVLYDNVCWETTPSGKIEKRRK